MTIIYVSRPVFKYMLDEHKAMGKPVELENIAGMRSFKDTFAEAVSGMLIQVQIVEQTDFTFAEKPSASIMQGDNELWNIDNEEQS